MAVKKQIIVRWMLTTLWIAIGAGTVVLLAAAIRKQDAKRCRDVDINIKGVSNNFFVDKKEILNSVIAIGGCDPIGQPVKSFDLKTMEADLQKNTWVKAAQMFFDNNEVLRVNVMEREPVARVFTTTGTTFYIDSSIAMLPLSDKFSARLPVFTGFPSDKMVLSKMDSVLLKGILLLSTAIQNDPFCMAMIEQVDITPQRTFEMVPKLGKTIIVFGDATEIEEKFSKLKQFYKEVIVKAGWNYYSQVNLQYTNQVVAKRKDAEDKSADSLRTLQLMQLIATDAERRASDSLQTIVVDNEHNSTDVNLIQQSIERDEITEPSYTIEKPKPQGALVVTKPILPYAPPPVKRLPNPVTNSNISKPLKKQAIIKAVSGPKKISAPVAKPVIKSKPPNPVKPKAILPKPVIKKSTVVKPANEY